jgi:hypothetical protein
MNGWMDNIWRGERLRRKGDGQMGMGMGPIVSSYLLIYLIYI